MLNRSAKGSDSSWQVRKGHRNAWAFESDTEPVLRPFLKILFLGLFATLVSAQSHPDFSGSWRQVNERCEPKPKNELYAYRADIDQSGALLKIAIAVSGTKESGQLQLRYEIGGDETVYTGLDHDQFHVTSHWEGDKLVFKIKELERGEVNESTETWTLEDGGHTLKRVRQGGGDGKKDRIYVLEKH